MNMFIIKNLNAVRFDFGAGSFVKPLNKKEGIWR